MIIVKKYLIKKKNDNFTIIPKEDLYCECGSPVLKRGSKGRWVIDSEGNRRRYILKRVYCPKCNKLHMVVPEFIFPFKHYDKKVIKSVQQGENDCCCADNSTLYRWKNM